MTGGSDWSVPVEFDDERAVAEARIALVATLAQRLEIEALTGDLVRLRRDRPGAANADPQGPRADLRDSAGAESNDDVDLLSAGARAGCWAAIAPT
jgi:hypothetical protein